MHAVGCGCNNTTPDTWFQLWQSKSSFQSAYGYIQTGTYQKCIPAGGDISCHTYPKYGPAVAMTFSQPEPVMASLGFVGGEVQLQYWWQGSTASSSYSTGNKTIVTPAAGMPTCAQAGQMVPPLRLAVQG